MRRENVIVNSTPIIALREIGRLEILRDLTDIIVDEILIMAGESHR